MKKSAKKRYTGARATSNKVREALFDILMADIKGARFLDLYAGSGGVGIEALRRGAGQVTLVEFNRKASEELFKTLETAGSPDKAVVARKKSITFLNEARDESLMFDIIFLDPPYHSDEIDRALDALSESGIIAENGTVVAEHFVKKELPDKFDKFIKIRDYHYGDTVLTVYRKEGASSR